MKLIAFYEATSGWYYRAEEITSDHLEGVLATNPSILIEKQHGTWTVIYSQEDNLQPWHTLVEIHPCGRLETNTMRIDNEEFEDRKKDLGLYPGVEVLYVNFDTLKVERLCYT